MAIGIDPVKLFLENDLLRALFVSESERFGEKV
jgi:hypothetical protein